MRVVAIEKSRLLTFEDGSTSVHDAVVLAIPATVGYLPFLASGTYVRNLLCPLRRSSSQPDRSNSCRG